ncbi:MAG: serine/threonine protein kinase [Planctomycetes bacterium]|nr:serine/threonine protein kinase [Planctomycetota bacterium]
MGLLDKVAGLFRPAGPSETPFLQEYDNLQQLGAGSSGVIYTAQHRQSRDTRVIKKMKCATPEARRRLHRELEVCLGINHENIIRYLGYQQKDGSHWVLAEYFRGSTLRQFLREALANPKARPPFLTGRDFLVVFLQAVRGLQHVHSRGFLHLDIKPENIMASGLSKSAGISGERVALQKGTEVIRLESAERARAIKVKILDFGVSIREGEQAPVGGSIFYLSPEVADGKKVGGEGISQRSDIYSLGATMYELATGDPPYLPEFFAKKGKNWTLFWKEYEALPKLTRSAYEKEMLESRRSKEPDFGRIPYGEAVRQILKKCLEYPIARRYAQTYTLLKDAEVLCENL